MLGRRALGAFQLRELDRVQLHHEERIAALIDLEKPAHTFYDLDLQFPTMQIGVTSTIGVDTLLGTGTDTSTLQSK